MLILNKRENKSCTTANHSGVVCEQIMLFFLTKHLITTGSMKALFLFDVLRVKGGIF